jgi:hypothetical protein
MARPRPDGHELCFTMSVSGDCELVADRVARIARVYPGCTVVLLTDTGADWSLGRRPAVLVTRATGGSLYALENGGRVVQVHLEAFLQTDARWWFKIDPDTVVRRAFADLPTETCCFGTVQGGNPGPSLQGGCIGGTRGAARRLASGLLGSPAILDPGATWGRGNPHVLARARNGLVSFDFIHAWACRELGIPLRDHPEIRSEWKRPPDDAERYAVTHPHKTLDEASERRAAAAREQAVGRVLDMIDASVPPGATVAVVSKGDARLTALPRHTGRHFPSDAEGRWAGFHPTDSSHALLLLAAERRRGSDHLVLPETAAWWLEHYDGLARRLASRYMLVADVPGAGRVWSLAGRARP